MGRAWRTPSPPVEPYLASGKVHMLPMTRASSIDKVLAVEGTPQHVSAGSKSSAHGLGTPACDLLLSVVFVLTAPR